MAGNYPDAPSWRMAYDRDGSIGALISSTNAITQLTGVQMQDLNSEADAPDWGYTTTLQRWAVIFPELRDVDAYFLAVKHAINTADWSVEVSEDTTNGVDGTWATLAGPFASSALPQLTSPFFRSPSSVTALAVRAVRVTYGGGTNTDNWLKALHIFGERSPGQALNALELWHPTNDEKLPPAWLDWGNTPRGSSEDRTFRVKNISGTSTAEDVRVAMDVLTDGSPSVPGQHLLSYGGGSYLAQVNVGDLAPGAISGPVTLRRVSASDAQLGLFAFRVFAEPDAWA